VNELVIALQRSGDPANLSRLRPYFDELAKIDPSPDSETPLWGISHLEVTLTVPGLLLAFFEAIVLVSISVALSTRLPMLANFVICFTIYVLGHITPLLVQSEITFAPVVFIGQFIATILPVLDHFNIQAAVAAGKQVPWVYLGWAFLYSLMYSAIAMLLALVLFEDKDLA